MGRSRNSYFSSWLIACVLACASCGGDDAEGGGEAGKSGNAGAGGKGGADAGPPAATPVEGGFCCTPSKEPSCCMAYGGFSTDEQGCSAGCDGMPSPSEAWKLETDEHGCKHWVEPREWTNCCGCQPHTRSCSPDGTWKITYQKTSSNCAPLTDTFTLSSDDDAGTAEVVFQRRGLTSNSECGGGGSFLQEPSYEATATVSENGCVVTLSSHAKWCSHHENQCDELDLKLYLHPFKSDAEVEGTIHKCWCGSSGPEGTKLDLKGTAVPAN